MNACGYNLSVWVGDRVACIRITGRANCSASVGFKAVIQRLRDEGHHRLVLDMSKCILLDSTFVGVLAGFSRDAQAEVNGAPCISIELFKPSSRVCELLDNLGLIKLFKRCEQSPVDGAELKEVPHTPARPDRVALARTSLEAHQRLMEINPKNVPKFKDVTQFLAEDLKKKAGSDS